MFTAAKKNEKNYMKVNKIVIFLIHTIVPSVYALKTYERTTYIYPSILIYSKISIDYTFFLTIITFLLFGTVMLIIQCIFLYNYLYSFVTYIFQ